MALTAHAGFTSPKALDAMYGAGAAARVASAKILVVGAGGVGCELVKDLAGSGFVRITLVDLDTIDVSNLNRQFLFRRKHVGRSKADVAGKAVEAMVEGLGSGLQVEPIVGNVKDARFDVDWFKTYDVVCNALDNLEARQHVNRMCLAAGVALIESGSTGYNGQVQVIGKGLECYDCHEKPKQKSYAVCTIRSTPDKPVHCIVWAKHLWSLIFGEEDPGNVLADLDGGGTEADAKENAEKNEEGNCAEGKNNGVVAAPSASLKAGKAKRVRYEPGEPVDSFARRVATRVYVDDINEQRAMEALWQKDGRVPPTVFECEGSADLSSLDLIERRVWSREESGAVFLSVLRRVASNRAEEIGTLSFDKDDPDALAFVVAASNLRAAAYGVDMQSPFNVKGIAGNIVHAIATTNAMVAGLITLEAIKVTVEEGEPTKEARLKNSLSTFVRKVPGGSRRMGWSSLVPEELAKPNPSCYVCSTGMLPLEIDVDAWTLGEFTDIVGIRHLGTSEPSIYVNTGSFDNLVLEVGEGLEDDEEEMYAANRNKTLRELKVHTGSHLIVNELRQQFVATLVVKHVPNLLEERAKPEQFSITGAIPAAKPNSTATQGDVGADDGIQVQLAPVGSANGDPDDGILIIDPEKGPAQSVAERKIGQKHARDDSAEDAEPLWKKAKAASEGTGDDVVVLD